MKKFQYQLIFLGDITNPACDTIKQLFLKKISELGLSEDAIDIIGEDEFTNKYNNKQPTFAYYLGDSNNSIHDNSIINKLLLNGDPIYPLYFNENAFSSEIPSIIHQINATFYNPDNLDAVVDCSLESFRLLRKARRIFISYKRSEATGVAQQLFDLLIKKGFDPFLDSYSIRPAEDFQEELLHRLTDCDVLIQLHTSQFYESKWCRKEIEEANLKQIGIVIILWPDISLNSFSHISTPLKLSNDHFSEGSSETAKIINKEVLTSIATNVESVRARNLAARQDSICGEFIAEAAKVGKTIVKEYRYLLEKDEAFNTSRIFIPAIGVPQSYDFFESRTFRKLLNNDHMEIYLLYDNLRIRQKWIEHLDWLNDKLDVKTIKRKDFDVWLRNH